MATTTYFLRSDVTTSHIYIRLSVRRGLVLKRKTGFTIDPADWSLETNMPKQGNEKLKNLRTKLKKLETHIEDGLNNLTSAGSEPTADWLQEQIDKYNGKKKVTDEDQLTNYIEKYIGFLPYKEYPNGHQGATRATITKYNTLKSKIEVYEQFKKKKFYLKDVNPLFRDELVKFFREVEKLGANTAGRYIKFLKTVCLDAQANNREVSPQLRLVRGFTEKIGKIYLTFDELEKIEAASFTRPALDNARDWLLIGCYIGQRVGDLLTLTSANIVTRAGLELIELTQEKTGKQVAIPLHPKVKEIIDRRGGKFPDKICDQKFNEHIKDLCKLAGLDQLIQGAKAVKIAKGQTRKQVGVYPKHELVTSHICRRSFASNFYGEIPTALLINITAHATERQFLEYIGKTSDDYAIQLAEYWRQMALKAEKKPQMTVVREAK